jgi:predicted nucleotidyltransferase
MSSESRLRQMRALATEQCKELMKEKYAIGAFLFGSAASGDIREESDVDLAVVYNTVTADIKIGKEERKVDGSRVEVWRYPIVPFINTFEDEKLRDKPDTWMWTSLWIEAMQKGIVIADPTKRLADWQAKAKQWKWRQSEIKPALKQAEDNLKTVRGYLAKRGTFDSLVCLREALTCLSAAYLMKHGLIPSFRPKDLSQKIRLLSDREEKLSNVYEFVNDAADLDYNLVEGWFLKLKEFVDSEWGTRRLGPRSELESARSCLNKRDLVGAVLSLRYSAYWLGFHIVNKREQELHAEICNGENHVKMVNRLATASEAYHEFYKQLHFVGKWNAQKLEIAASQAEGLLSIGQSDETREM